MKSEHHRLQEAIIEGFLPRFGNSANLLYIRYPQGKVIVADVDRLLKLGLSNRDKDKLPNIVAYSKAKNWLYLIEPVQSANPWPN